MKMAGKKATMTDRERVEALLKHEKPDRVPLSPCFAQGFCALYYGVSIGESYGNPTVHLAAARKTYRDFGWVWWPFLAYAAMGGWEFGGEIKLPDSEFAQAPTVSRHPVDTPEEAMKLTMPDIKTAGVIPRMMEFCKLSSQERLDNEPWNVTSMIFGPFTVACNITGPEKLAKWALKKPETVHYLVRLVNDFLIAVAEYWKDTFGIEGVLPLAAGVTSSNQIISPKQFEEFVFPYQKELHQKTLDMGYKNIYVHICGEQNENLPYWAQIPMGDPGIISIGHEVELETAAKYFPNDIIFGNLNPTILQVGTPDDVYEASKVLIERGKKIPGGFIFAPGCEIPPVAPVDNIMAMTKAVNDFGWYD